MARSETSVKSSRPMVLASVAIVIAALYVAQEVLKPLALAILLTFLLAPLVHWFERLRSPRWLAVAVTVAIAFSILGAVGYVVYNQMDDLARNFQQYRANIQGKVDSFRSSGGLFKNVQQAGEEVRHILSAPTTSPATPTTAPATGPASQPVEGDRQNTSTASAASQRTDEKPQHRDDIIIRIPEPSAPTKTPLQMVEDFGGQFLGPAGTAFIVIVFTIFMLLQREDLRDRLIRLVGRNRLTITTEAMDDAAARVSRYLVMQSIINGAFGVATMILLWGVGQWNGKAFPSPALFGLLVGLLRFIPYVGVWAAVSLPLVLSLAVYESARVAIEIVVGFVVLEIVAANVLEPMLFGASTGLTTLAVLVAAAFWTWLWGPVGLLLSTPMTVCVVVVGKYVPGLSFLTVLLADAPPLSPPDRVYQRLLAADEEEAEELVDEYAKKMPLEELYDTVITPALAMAERDRHLGNLDADRHAAIRRGIRDMVDDLGDRQRALQARASSQSVVDQARSDGSTAGAPGAVKPPPASILQPPGGDRVLLPQGCIINVVCLPAHDESDEIAAIMLAQLLQMRGYCATPVSVEQLASEMVSTVEKLNGHLVCVSALPPGAVRHARYLCKRLRSKLPALRMVIGLWTLRAELKDANERMGCTGEVQTTGTLVEALRQVHQMVQPELMAVERPPATPPVTAG